MAEKRAFKRLDDLGPEVVQHVDEMLASGIMPSKVAEWLHDEGHLHDLKLASIKKNLERYRDNVLGEKNRKAMIPAVKQTAAFKKKLLAVDELTDLYLVQRARLEKLLLKEKTLPEGIMMNEATKQVQLTREVLDTLGKLQLETGIMRRAPKTLTGSFTDTATGEEKQFSWTEEHAALREELDAIDADFEVVSEREPDRIDG